MIWSYLCQNGRILMKQLPATAWIKISNNFLDVKLFIVNSYMWKMSALNLMLQVLWLFQSQVCFKQETHEAWCSADMIACH